MCVNIDRQKVVNLRVILTLTFIKCLIHLSMLSPREGRGGGWPYKGHLITINVLNLRNFTESIGPRVWRWKMELKTPILKTGVCYALVKNTCFWNNHNVKKSPHFWGEKTEKIPSTCCSTIIASYVFFSKTRSFSYLTVNRKSMICKPHMGLFYHIWSIFFAWQSSFW